MKQESNGVIDRSFATSGMLHFAHDNGAGIITAGGKGLLDREGRILLILRKYIEFSASRVDERVDILRVRADGHFDSGFDHGRDRLLSIGLERPAPVSATITASNKLLILIRSDTVGKSVVAIARLNLD